MIEAGSNESLQALQNGILESIVRGQALDMIAQRICLDVEHLAPDVICTILTVDAQGALRPLAAPSLPDHFSQALEGQLVGPRAGSCGTAAWRGEAVEVVDIATDPLWEKYRALALPLGLLACWSNPIKARDGGVIGAFAFYYRVRRGPAELERRIVEKCVDLCAIAIEHEAAQSRIHRLAYFDTLTGLPNRMEFADRAARLLGQGDGGRVVNLLYVDLDDFKIINDSLGHSLGDLLLEGVAQRLASCLGDGAFAARIGGDQFAVLESGSGDPGEGPRLAQKIILILDDPFEIDDRRVTVGVNIGITQASAATPLAELAKRAELALFEAKCEGRGTWRIFRPAMEAALQSRRSLKQDLRNAIDAREFTLVYQPIVVLASNALRAAEVLVRWKHPLRGSISPAVFIPIVEEMGLIGALGDWVLREACQVAASWPREIKIGVNLSPLQFRKPGFILDVISALHQAGLPANRLELEVTESALLARDITTRTALHDLHDFGVRLSLDDFGTGYASLQSLRSFPFDRIKIDMSFVRDIDMDADSTAIIRAVIDLARDLSMKTTAEGIETKSQLDWLVQHGCDEGQGYYFSKPMAGAQLQALLERSDRDDELIVPRPEQVAGGP